MVAPVIDGSQATEDRLKKLLSDLGPFGRLEAEIADYQQLFAKSETDEKFLTSPMSELKNRFYKYIAQKFNSLFEHLNIRQVPDMMKKIPGYSKVHTAMEQVVLRFEKYYIEKPWSNFPTSGDELKRITTFLSELEILILKLKDSFGGKWSSYY